MMRLALVGSLAGVLSACAVTPVEQQRQSRWSYYPTVRQNVLLSQENGAKNSDKYICNMEKVIGSAVPERVCRVVNDETEMAALKKRQETQDKWLELQRPSHTSQ